MKYFLTGLFSFLLFGIVQVSGATVNTWRFWALFALVLAIITVQYIGR